MGSRARRRDQRDPRLVGHRGERAARSARDRDIWQSRLQRRSPADPPPEAGLSRAATHDDARRSARRLGRRRRCLGDERVGGRARRHALHALVPAADRHHRRKARLVSLADRRRQGGGRILGQGAGARRTGRVELPVGRHALHLRSARLHGLGSDQPAVAAQERQLHDARHPDGVRQLDRRSARQEDAAAALDGSACRSRRFAS